MYIRLFEEAAASGLHTPSHSIVDIMPFLFVLAAILLPRGVIVFAWITSGWFDGIFETLLWPILGFLFAPLTMLWYSVVVRVYGGNWDTLQIVILVIAVLIDMSPSARKRKKSRKD